MEDSKLIKFWKYLRPLLDWVRASDDVKDFIVCQFALESNFGDSRLSRDCNNFCGMRYPRVRIAVDCSYDEKSGFAKYPSIYHCINDYFLALQFHKPNFSVMEDVESFKAFIKNWYCPESNYVSNIQFMFNQLNSYKNGKRD